jgi:hypothetical protein
MARWRKEAFEYLPELRKELQEEKETPYLFFHEVQRHLQGAIAEGNDDLVSRVYAFLLWCIEDAPRGNDASDDIATIAVTAFFEDVPNNKTIRQDIGKRVPKRTLVGLKEAFLYHGNEEVYQEILNGNKNGQA